LDVEQSKKRPRKKRKKKRWNVMGIVFD